MHLGGHSTSDLKNLKTAEIITFKLLLLCFVQFFFRLHFIMFDFYVVSSDVVSHFEGPAAQE